MPRRAGGQGDAQCRVPNDDADLVQRSSQLNVSRYPPDRLASGRRRGIRRAAKRDDRTSIGERSNVQSDHFEFSTPRSARHIGDSERLNKVRTPPGNDRPVGIDKSPPSESRRRDALFTKRCANVRAARRQQSETSENVKLTAVERRDSDRKRSTPMII